MEWYWAGTQDLSSLPKSRVPIVVLAELCFSIAGFGGVKMQEVAQSETGARSSTLAGCYAWSPSVCAAILKTNPGGGELDRAIHEDLGPSRGIVGLSDDVLVNKASPVGKTVVPGASPHFLSTITWRLCCLLLDDHEHTLF